MLVSQKLHGDYTGWPKNGTFLYFIKY